MKETHMVKFTHGLKAHEMLLWDWLAMSNLHLLTMTTFSYNMKKMRVIWNEIMVFHNQYQPTTQNPHPYIKETWKKSNYNINIARCCLNLDFNQWFLKGKDLYDASKDPPSDEFNKVFKQFP